MYAIGIARSGDERIGQSIRWMYSMDTETYDLSKEYDGTDQENLQLFFESFVDGIRNELQKYDCKDDQLLELINGERYQFN
jgi:hypothetical protein